jgi:hypothetical protein
MIKRLLAIAFIFLCTSVAWLILGTTILVRTGSTGDRLRGRVESIWGAPQVQSAPYAEYSRPVVETEVVKGNGKQETVERTRYQTRTVRPSSSEVAVELLNQPRRKGLLWYSTYKVRFQGAYVFRNAEWAKQSLRLCLRFPNSKAIYDDLQFTVDGRPLAPTTEKETAYVTVEVPSQQDVKLQLSYRSQGLDSWKYSFGQDVNPVQDFHLRMTTSFTDIDFPDNTLAPTDKQEFPAGWQLDWNYKRLVSGYEIAMSMPEKLQPGPLASEISYFAPISLFFFFFLIFLITTLRNIDLHPMNYFFLGAAFFAFHLLLAYLADHLDIHLSFAISSAVSVFLVVTYLRLVVGMQFAVREAALTQFIYLVLFSYAFFFKGLTGLTITIGAILTLFVVMQMTGRIRWSERFGAFDSRPTTAKTP